MNTISTDRFKWINSDRCFTADISDLADFPYINDILSIVSSRTGQIVDYTLAEVDRDGEADILCWVFEPTPESKQRVPDCQETFVVIYND